MRFHNYTHTQVDRPEDCVGKTIDGCFFDGEYLGFRFADGTYFFCQADDEFSEGPNINVRPEPHMEAAGKMGIAEAEEYAKFLRDMAKMREASERAHYERLREKFEAAPATAAPPPSASPAAPPYPEDR